MLLWIQDAVKKKFCMLLKKPPGNCSLPVHAVSAYRAVMGTWWNGKLCLGSRSLYNVLLSCEYCIFPSPSLYILWRIFPGEMKLFVQVVVDPIQER